MVIHITTVFMGFFAIMNPLANTPVFLALTADDDAATRRLIARKSLFIAFIIVTAFALAGNLILGLFGITLAAFRITGGILVFGIGYSMLKGETSKVHATDVPSTKESRLSVAVSPLAIPILAGPGTIATAMSYSADVSPAYVAMVVLAFSVLCGICYVFFVAGEKLTHFLGPTAIGAVTRMMGLILAVIAAQMFIDGTLDAFSVFADGGD